MTPKPAAQALDRLIKIVALLRSPQGCPWDRKQTSASLKRFLLEETHEVLEAMDDENTAAIRLELGDLLLQIVLLSQLHEEQNLFDFSDVANGIADKMIRRHPHVFQGAGLNSLEELDRQWDRIKAEEKQNQEKQGGLLEGIPRHLPALLKAQKVGEKAGRVGFDWKNSQEVAEKIREELNEFIAACAQQSAPEMEHEFGDLLFSLVNLARFLDIVAEDALRKAVARFQKRFKYIEDQLQKNHKNWEDTSLETMNSLWEEAKRSER